MVGRNSQSAKHRKLWLSKYELWARIVCTLVFAPRRTSDAWRTNIYNPWPQNRTCLGSSSSLLFFHRNPACWNPRDKNSAKFRRSLGTPRKQDMGEQKRACHVAQKGAQAKSGRSEAELCRDRLLWAQTWQRSCHRPEVGPTQHVTRGQVREARRAGSPQARLAEARGRFRPTSTALGLTSAHIGPDSAGFRAALRPSLKLGRTPHAYAEKLRSTHSCTLIE